MKKILFEFNDLKIIEETGRYYAIYDAGSHQVVMRKDEISKEEAEIAIQSKDDAIQVLFQLQKRLSEAGINPYESNTEEA